MKILFVTALILGGIVSSVSAQQLVDHDTFKDTLSGQIIKTGDDLNIGVPANKIDFAYIENESKNKWSKLGKLASAAGSVGDGLLIAGIGKGSVGAVKAGAEVSGAGNVLSGVSSAANTLSPAAKKIAGKKLRILKFKSTGNSRRGVHVFAIVAGTGKENYKVELLPAIRTGEVAGVNDKEL